MCTHEGKNSVVKEAIVLQWAVRITLWDFKPGKKRWAGALGVLFVMKTLEDER